MDESEFKTKVAAKLRKEGGYGRRLEDKFGVGVFDLVLIPKGGPVFFTEAKIIRASTWGATPRQREELRRVVIASGQHGYGCEMGFDLKTRTISLRRIDDEDKARHHQYEIEYWTTLDVTGFLKYAHEDWSKHVR